MPRMVCRRPYRFPKLAEYDVTAVTVACVGCPPAENSFGTIGIADVLKICGAKEIRTPDLFDANEALYQLSYSPEATPVLTERRCRCP